MRRSRTRSVAGALCVAALLLATACSDPDEDTLPGDPPAGDRPTGQPTGEDGDQPLSEVAVTLTQVATGAAPTAGVPGPDGTVWIAERAGRVRPLEPDGLGEPVLDIAGETTTDGERGLLGIAFDEGFEHFYISFTDRDGTSRIDEFTMSGGEIRTGSRRTLLTQQQPYANHNGGDLTVGPDGMLYIGFGDGGSGGDPHGNGQDLTTLLGKLLRIDPGAGDPYAAPPDNPFVGEPDSRDEAWAYGLRNPWRFSFDAGTGDLWIADVGQSDLEEVDWVAAGSGAGANFGWSRMEGTQPFNGDEPADHVPPVYEYETTEDRCSITGGYVYRGDAIPGLQGAYLFSDYCEGDLRALRLAQGELSAEANLGVDGGAVVSFVQGPDREIYLLDLGGAIHRIDPA